MADFARRRIQALGGIEEIALADDVMAELERKASCLAKKRDKMISLGPASIGIWLRKR